MLNYVNTNILALCSPHSVLYYLEQHNMCYGIQRMYSKNAFMVFGSLHELVENFTELDKETYYTS